MESSEYHASELAQWSRLMSQWNDPGLESSRTPNDFEVKRSYAVCDKITGSANGMTDGRMDKMIGIMPG